MAKLIFTLVLFATRYTVHAQDDNQPKIQWPAVYEPSKSKFYVHNEIEINADPEVVWDYLIDALQWPSWYKGAKNVSFISPQDTVLNPHAIFKWETMGLKLETAIRQFEPYRLLAWESKKKSIQAYHVWLIIPTERGCKIITDETQNGWLTFFEKIFQRNKLKRLHDVWLSELKKKAETKSVEG